MFYFRFSLTSGCMLLNLVIKACLNQSTRNSDPITKPANGKNEEYAYSRRKTKNHYIKKRNNNYNNNDNNTYYTIEDE